MSLGSTETSPPIEQANPLDDPEHESVLCLKEQRDVSLSPWDSLESRLAKLGKVAWALRAIIKWHPGRLNPQMRRTAERYLNTYDELKKPSGTLSNFTHRIWPGKVNQLSTHLFATHRGASAQVTQVLYNEIRDEVRRGRNSDPTAAGSSMVTPVDGSSEILETSEDVMKLTSDMASSMDQMATKREQKFCQYLDSLLNDSDDGIIEIDADRVERCDPNLPHQNLRIQFHHNSAEGSFGAVYKGRMNLSDQVLAVKFPVRGRRAHIDNEFKEEAKIWKLLRHENILPLLGICVMGDFLGLISPFISGSSWRYRIKEFDSHHNVVFLRHIAAAVDHMHNLEIIHGDIKADNVLIDSTPKAILCDFGLSLNRKTDSTQPFLKNTGSGIYRDPQLRDSKGRVVPKNRSSDVWAFSITMAHVLDPDGKLPMTSSDSSDSNYEKLYHRMVQGGKRPIRSPRLVGAPQTAWDLAERCWTVRKADGEAVRRPSMSFILNILQKIDSGAREDAHAELATWDRTPHSTWNVQDIPIPEPAGQETP